MSFIAAGRTLTRVSVCQVVYRSRTLRDNKALCSVAGHTRKILCILHISHVHQAADSDLSAGRQGFSTSAIKRADVAKMTLIGRLGATPEAIKDKQGRDLLVYSVATLDRAQVNSDGCEFLEATPAKTGRRCCNHERQR